MCRLYDFCQFFKPNKGTLNIDEWNTKTAYNTIKYVYKVDENHEGFDELDGFDDGVQYEDFVSSYQNQEVMWLQ